MALLLLMHVVGNCFLSRRSQAHLQHAIAQKNVSGMCWSAFAGNRGGSMVPHEMSLTNPSFLSGGLAMCALELADRIRMCEPGLCKPPSTCASVAQRSLRERSDTFARIASA